MIAICYTYRRGSHTEEFHQSKEEARESTQSSTMESSNREKLHLDINVQQTLLQVLQTRNPYPRTSMRWKTLTDSVCYFIPGICSCTKRLMILAFNTCRIVLTIGTTLKTLSDTCIPWLYCIVCPLTY